MADEHGSLEAHQTAGRRELVRLDEDFSAELRMECRMWANGHPEVWSFLAEHERVKGESENDEPDGFA